MEPDEEQRQYRLTRCADGEAEVGDVVPEWHEILTRPAVRFAPGWITALTSDPGAATLSMSASDAAPGDEVELWMRSDNEPAVGGSGIAEVGIEPSGDEQWTVTAVVCAASYEVTLDPDSGPGSGPDAASAPESCP